MTELIVPDGFRIKVGLLETETSEGQDELRINVSDFEGWDWLTRIPCSVLVAVNVFSSVRKVSSLLFFLGWIILEEKESYPPVSIALLCSAETEERHARVPTDEVRLGTAETQAIWVVTGVDRLVIHVICWVVTVGIRVIC